MTGYKCPVCGMVDRYATWFDIARFKGENRCFKIKADNVEYIDDIGCFDVIDKVNDIMGDYKEVFLLTIEPEKFTKQQILSTGLERCNLGAVCTHCNSVLQGGITFG